MSGVHRLLTRRDKRNPKTSESVIGDGDLGSIFTIDGQSHKKKTDKDEDKKVKAVKARLQAYGITNITNANIEYALRSHSVEGNVEEALRLCLLLEDTYEGLLKSFNPSTKLLGAVNRQGVTCYLDALLFAMFARLDGFEAMLYNSLEDAPRKKLAGLLRLWVNLLRTGRLIETDVTQHVQAALAECGWSAANRLEQQDTSEAFGFITGQLELPLLTLKMDLFHTGKEDVNDDHKFVNERLLEVALIDAPRDGKGEITLEDCLEHYFNNRVEVKRHLEQQRRQSAKESDDLARQFDTAKMPGLNISAAEVDSDVETPSTEIPKKTLAQQLRPTVRGRADSIFSQRRVNTVESTSVPAADESAAPVQQSKKSNTATRTEVLMPAWQFFKLLPWYTDNMPTSDAQVAAHFASKRPILGICLKRYLVTNAGVCERLDTYVDIPLEIAVPDFVSNDSMDQDGPLVGNFKLVLQSVVCHRGTSLHSGHYISLVRGHAANAVGLVEGAGSTARDDDNSWMLFDDMAKERVKYVDIAKALKDESPYLLFYQVQPIDEDEPMIGGPPSYDEAVSRSDSDPFDVVNEKFALPEYSDNGLVYTDIKTSAGLASVPLDTANDRLSATNYTPRTSLDFDSRRGRGSISSDRRRSIAGDGDRSSGIQPYSASGATTPNEESRLGFLNLPSRRGSRHGARGKPKSRPTSVGAESTNRFTLGMSRLATRISRGDLPPVPSGSTPGTSVDAENGFAELDRSSVNAVEQGSPVLGSTDVEGGSAATSGSVEQKPWKKKDKVVAVKDNDGEGKKSKKGQIPDRDCRVM